MLAPKPSPTLAGLTRAFVTGPLRRHEAVLIFGLAAVAFVLLEHLDAASGILAFALHHERLPLADLWVVISLFGVALIATTYRRNRDLRGENRARQAAEAESWNLARHDALTGLPNRRYFTEMVTAALQRI